MNFQSYLAEFGRILDNPTPPPPYDNAAYLDYTRLNWSRMNRWLKKGELSTSLIEVVKGISQPQHWLVITEPWCGDAAHSVPFIQLVAQLNPLISVEYELRDSEPFRINDYLTNGSKSIPKLIIRDSQGADLATWGPRPVECQKIFDRLKVENADFEQQKIATQQWYNADKGQSVQAELETILSAL
ncbi:thioredoxin family protein [Parapedobacter sp. 10938]|uniref:thioredoxin family protein n=1 Tax=Parapedobacter flavus TaxID=3110225 RepID=UPI002DC04009|nr:thioredoxin family protein [Parapedobacter sp. 10938]MEC3878210.1 thioredoxin family protein [Parapedobacter sp. 10938]